VEDLEKASESANHENGLLRAQVERLQVELREYRKRLSWISSNGVGRAQAPVGATQFKNNPVSNHNDFKFEFPKFGDLPPMPTNMFNDSSAPPQKSSSSSSPGTITANRAATVPTPSSTPLGQQATRHATSGAVSQHPTPRYGSLSQSPISNTISASPQPQPKGSVDSLTGLFSPSILEASRHASFGGYFPQNTFGNATQGTRPSMDNGTATGRVPGVYSSSSMSNNSDSPGSSSESHNAVSSIGTSPEPSLNSPANKLNEYNLNTISEDNQLSTFGGKDYLCNELQKACGCVENPVPPILNMSNDKSLALSSSTPVFDANGVNWLTQQNGSNFDPILFGDYRDTQDNILSQDFGSFFNDAYPLPDLGSPLHNYNEVAPDSAPKIDLLKQVDATQDGKEEVVPDSDNKPLTCNKIWSVSSLPQPSSPHLVDHHSGTDCNRWRNSAMVRLISTICAANSGPRPSARKVAPSSRRKTWTRSWEWLNEPSSCTPACNGGYKNT